MAHTSCMLDKQNYMHARVSICPRARAHACTRAHTQTNMEYLPLFHSNNDSRTHLSVTLYVHCQSCYNCDCVLSEPGHEFFEQYLDEQPALSRLREGNVCG